MYYVEQDLWPLLIVQLIMFQWPIMLWPPLLSYKFTKQLLIVAIFQGFPSTAQLPAEQESKEIEIIHRLFLVRSLCMACEIVQISAGDHGPISDQPFSIKKSLFLV